MEEWPVQELCEEAGTRSLHPSVEQVSDAWKIET